MPKSKDEVQKDVMAILLGDEPDDAIQSAPKTMSIDKLVPFTNHPFKLYKGKRLADMVQSVKEYGVLVPIIIRPLNEDEGTYEILSGHNRVNAAQIAGLTEVPVIIKTGLSEYEARIIVTLTNLYQRSFGDLPYSERAIVLKYHVDTNKSQGQRNDLLDEIEKLSKPHEYREDDTSGLIVPRLEARDKAAEEYDLDARTVSRYIRLCELNEALLDRVDNKKIGLYPAVSISYISPDEQAELNRLLDETPYKVDMKKAESLREFSENKKLTNENMLKILSGELNKKSKSKTAPPLKIKAKIYQKYFDSNTTQAEMEATIDQALAEYFKNHKQKEAIA